jgi:sugar phosphate isomerase/epimerase
MEIKYICTYWGQAQLPVDEFIDKALDAGFDGVEMNVPNDVKFVDDLQNKIEKAGAIFIAQQYLPPAIETVDEYRKRLQKYLLHLAALKPLFINSHTGKDFFSFDDNCKAIEDTIDISNKTGVKIIHETHRGRFAFHPASILPYLKRFESLELTADFSHFTVVSESLLSDQEHILNEIIPRCSYVHARVGFNQAAQVNHPFTPEWATTVNQFLKWWQQIIDLAKSNEETTFYVCPEFGPAPYMPALPFTKQPVSNQWDINVQMMKYLKGNLK